MSSREKYNLSYEIILLIVSFYRKPSDSSTPEDIRELSLVCKAFNDACSTFLFYHYPLPLRVCGSQFSQEFARERISAIVRKAPFIRSVYIYDCNCNHSDTETLPDVIIPELVSALQYATGLTHLVLDNRICGKKCKERRVPLQLWTWMKDWGVRLNVLRFKGAWLPPEEAAALDQVESLHVLPITEENMQLLKFIKPLNLKLTNRENMDISSFAPLKRDNCRLRQINIELSGRRWKPWLIRHRCLGRKHLFDFTNIPSVIIKMRIWCTARIRFKSVEWQSIREVVCTIFADDITKFNIRRSEPMRALVYRVPGQRVVHQQQIADEKEDEKEELDELYASSSEA